jgi:hydroxymethylbilane synthase
LKRLGWGGRIAEILPAETMCSAVGQGALAIETRADGAGLEPAKSWITRLRTAAVTAERGAAGRSGRRLPGSHRRLRHVGPATAGCRLQAVVVSPDGVELVRDRSEGPAADAQRIGRELGEALLAAGADSILESVYG